MEMALPIKSTDIDLEEYGKSKHLPLGYRQIIDRGYHFFNPQNKISPFVLIHELPTLERPAFYQLIGEMNLRDLSCPDYHFTEVIGYLNAVQKYQFECIKSNSTYLIHDYYIIRIDNFRGYNNNVAKTFRKYKSQ